MILRVKTFDNFLLYLSLEVGVNFMNSQHLRLKWYFEKLDKYGPRLFQSRIASFIFCVAPQLHFEEETLLKLCVSFTFIILTLKM